MGSNMDELKKTIDYRVREEFKKYHNETTFEWNGEDFWIEQIVNKLAETITETHITKAVQAERNRILEGLPEKRSDAVMVGEVIPYDNDNKVTIDWLRKTQDAGFNQALDQVKAVIEQKEEV